MKKILFLILMCFTLFMVTSCDRYQTGDLVTTTIDHPTNSKILEVRDISVKIGYTTKGPKVLVKKSDTLDIKLTRQESIWNKISFKQEGEKLIISGEKNVTYKTDYDVTIELSGFTFETVFFYNAVDATFEEGTLTNNEVTMLAENASTVTIDALTCNKLVYESNNASSLTIKSAKVDDIQCDALNASSVDLKGSSRNIKVTVNNASTFKSKDFTADTVEVSINHASSLEITANTSITGRMQSAGTLKYAGAATVDVTKDVSSTIEKI